MGLMLMTDDTAEQTYDKFVKSFKNIEQLLKDTNCYLLKTDLSFLGEDYYTLKYSSQVYGVYTDIGEMRYYLAEGSNKRISFSLMNPSQQLIQRTAYSDFKKAIIIGLTYFRRNPKMFSPCIQKLILIY